MKTVKINDNVKIEKINEHYCVVKDEKNVELCFYSLADALIYTDERKY